MSKYKPGDRVEVTIVGEVVHSSGDFLQLENDVHLWTVGRGIQVRKLAPKKPKVGEVITGERLKATPWKRGTVVLSDDIPCLLTADGVWAEPDYVEGWTFDDVLDDDEFTVVYLPDAA